MMVLYNCRCLSKGHLSGKSYHIPQKEGFILFYFNSIVLIEIFNSGKDFISGFSMKKSTSVVQ